MQEQHQEMLKAIDLIRHDTEVSLQRFATALDVKLDVLNQAFASERERQFQALRSSNRIALTTASVIVGVLLIEILFLAWISVRTLNHLATRISVWISEQSPSRRTPVFGASAPPLRPGNLIEETPAFAAKSSQGAALEDVSVAGYIKCACRSCGGHIEYPSEGTGSVIDCPHCGQSTELGGEAPPAPAGKRKVWLTSVFVGIGILAVDVQEGGQLVERVAGHAQFHFSPLAL